MAQFSAGIRELSSIQIAIYMQLKTYTGLYAEQS